MDFQEVVMNRRSIRNYALRNISNDDIMTICDAARYAPMAGNIFTPRLIVIKKKERRELIAKTTRQPFVIDAPVLIIVCSEVKRIKEQFPDKYEIFLKQQIGASIQNMLLEVENLRLAACWIGYFDEQAIKRICGIPEDVQVEALIPIGKPAGRVIPLHKMPLKLTTYYEKWKQVEMKPTKIVPDQ